MPDDCLHVAQLKAGLLRAGEYLERNSGILNNLNVFPVPDGDTGTNMVATYTAGVRALAQAQSMVDVARAMTDAMTRQSRGNSGFILARFFHGFFEASGESSSIGYRLFADAFAAGAYRVNTSLFAPVEGTMITIIAAMTEAMRNAGEVDLLTGLRVALDAGRTALYDTPRLLGILARAGVVDSGALGFLFVMEGFHRGIDNREVETEDESVYRFPPDPSVATGPDVSEQMHRYCTEVLLRPLAGSDGQPAAGSSGLSDFLRTRGSSIALVEESTVIKVHIHTDDPEGIVSYLTSLGTILNTKIEDMQEQMGLFANEEDPESVNTVIACVPGTGFRELFVSLGIEHCIRYEAELPATATILEAIDGVESRNVTLLPNNKNILPSAMLARDRSEKNVSIIPTESIIQGIAALYGYSENASMQENARNMADSVGLVEAFFLYKSASRSQFDGMNIGVGDFFCVQDGCLLAVSPDPLEVAMKALRERLDDKTNVCLYTAGPESATTAQQISHLLEADFPDIQVECLAGGQSREYIIISLE